MSFLIVVGGIVLTLFFLSYLRSGRFGATILALGAGYILAQFWAEQLAVELHEFGSEVFVLSWGDVVYSSLVLLPGLLVLMLSTKQKSVLPRPLAGILLGAFVVALLLPILSATTVLDANSRALYTTVQQYQGAMITGGLLLGLFDTFFSSLPKIPKRSKH